ncbi:hypothetical protein PAMA_017624 [Pampus argenteus]
MLLHSKNTKAVIFMINLAIADLAHTLSLPLRIYYYFNHTWPFGRGMCLFCFYLKYLNMYAAIAFLVCISVQRCIFLLNPFSARRWRRRYDLLISVIVWVVVSLGCSPFILMRSSSNATGASVSTQMDFNMSYSLAAASTQHATTYMKLSVPPLSPSRLADVSSPSSAKGCFKDLPMRRLPIPVSVTMMVLAELCGFLIPLACICYSSIHIARSLRQRRTQDQPHATTINSSARNRTQSVTSTDKYHESQTNKEKRRALRMVLSCTALFLFCFAPYHLNFLLYLMVSQDIVSNCAMRLAVRQFHPVSLCMASLSCCLNPLLYYFLTAEFRLHLANRTYSITSTLLSSPASSTSRRPVTHRVMSMESNCSDRE